VKAPRQFVLTAASGSQPPKLWEVEGAQNDLVTVLGQFDPKLVKMAPSGERPED